MDTPLLERLKPIPWHNPAKLASAKVVVVGTGALGVLLAEHLTRNGVGTVILIDRDRVEAHNLSRSYTVYDVGQRKVQALASRLKAINPAVRLIPIHGDLEYDVGRRWFAAADLVMVVVDNRRTRLLANELTGFVRTRYLDGAIDGLTQSGVVRIIQPGDAPYSCLQCSWTARDYELLEQTMPCEKTPTVMPTTSTIAALVAGLMASEAIKYLLQNQPTQTDCELRIDAAHNQFFVSHLPKQVSACLWDHSYALNHHQTVDLGRVRDTDVGTLWELVEHHLGPDARLEWSRPFVLHWGCTYGHIQPGPRLFHAHRIVSCARCSRPMEPHHSTNTMDRSLAQRLADRNCSALGIPHGDILTATDQQGNRLFIQFELGLSHG